MNEVREVHHYDDTSTNSAWLAILVIAIVVAAGIMIAMWQPWAVPVRNDTTIIREGAAAPAPSTTVINPAPNVVVPPPVNPPKTDIRINNEVPPASTGTGTTGDNSNNSSTGD